MINATGRSSIPVKLLRQPKSAKGGVASTGFKGINDLTFGGTVRRYSTKTVVVQNNSTCTCSKKSFWDKALGIITGITAGATLVKGIVDFVSGLFGKKKADKTEQETPALQQTQPQVQQEQPETSADKTYYGGMFGEVTVTPGTNGTNDTNFNQNVKVAANELKAMYPSIDNIEVTEQEDKTYRATITYKGSDGKVQYKSVNVSDTKTLVQEVGNLMQELQPQELDNDVGKAAQQIKQIYGDIISDIKVTAQTDGTYKVKITIPDALKKGGNTAVKEVTVSNSKELDDEVFAFTQELWTTEDNNPFKAATTFENDLKSTDGADISESNIDQLVKSQVDLYNAYGDGEGDISLQDMIAYEKATAEESQTLAEIQTASKMFFGAYDADSDGQVTADELRSFYNEADADNNGKLTADELQSHVAATLEEKKGLDFDELASVRYGVNTQVPTQDKADSLVEMIKENFYSSPVKVSDKYVDYKDGQFRIADDENMTVNCTTATEEEVKKLYMGS